MEKWTFICLMEDGTKEKRSALADTPEEAKEIVLNKNRADASQKRIKDLMFVDM